MRAVRIPAVLVSRVTHFKVLALCFICTSVYVYLYSEVSLQSLTLHKMIMAAIGDFRSWQKQIWVLWDYIRYGELFTDTDSAEKDRNITRNYASTQVSRSRMDRNVSRAPVNTENLALDMLHTNATLLTLFTTWQTSVEKFTCHNNTVRNWNLLKPFVQPILFTNENELSIQVTAMGWKVLPVSKAGRGVPVLKNMYLDTIKVFNSTFYAYANGDILFTDTLIITLLTVLTSSLNKSRPLMVIGRRTNVDNVTALEARDQITITKAAEFRGTLFSAWGEDYFITMKNYPWKDIPDVIVGRRAYDNWLVLDARRRGHVVDATETILAVHQTTYRGNYEGHSHRDSDYNHNLLVRTFRRLHYAAGKTSCTELITRYNSTHAPQIQWRNPNKECYPL